MHSQQGLPSIAAKQFGTEFSKDTPSETNGRDSAAAWLGLIVSLGLVGWFIGAAVQRMLFP